MANRPVIWEISGKKKTYTDEEIVEAIRNGEVLAEDLITTRGLGAWVKVASSIYRFYLPEDDDIIH
ncbi:MAG: hypothetical protein K6D92_05415 [Erysipelotrichaceae bacterium]|jgi:hypothetical protein|nr:hypothetical protein [Erysipelotrichaceae bacterium]